MHILPTLICFTSLAFIAGCSTSNDNKEPPTVELTAKKRDSDSTKRSELTYFHQARRLYASELYVTAQDNFELLYTEYPNSPYAEFAELKAADCLFNLKKYRDAAARYEQFLNNYPASLNADYALYQRGRSFFKDFKGIGRETNPLERAQENLQKHEKLHPNSPYSPSRQAMLRSIVEHLNASQEVIANFYTKFNQDDAAKARLALLTEPPLPANNRIMPPVPLGVPVKTQLKNETSKTPSEDTTRHYNDYKENLGAIGSNDSSKLLSIKCSTNLIALRLSKLPQQSQLSREDEFRWQLLVPETDFSSDSFKCNNATIQGIKGGIAITLLEEYRSWKDLSAILSSLTNEVFIIPQ